MKTRSPPDNKLRPTTRLTRLPTGAGFRSIAFKRILVPLDFSTDSKNALRYAVSLARQAGASLTLLHVVEPIVSQADFGYGRVTTRSANQSALRHTQSALNVVARKLAESGSQPITMVRTGNAETEIVQAASDFAADLIVIGSHAQSGSPIPIGSTTEKVVRNTSCPVLVIRRKQSQTAPLPKRGAP